MSQAISSPPWAINLPRRNPPANLIIKDAQGRHIAYVTSPIASYPVVAVDLPEMIANARLMCAAPQLLQVAQLALCAAKRPITSDEARVLEHLATRAIHATGLATTSTPCT